MSVVGKISLQLRAALRCCGRGLAQSDRRATANGRDRGEREMPKSHAMHQTKYTDAHDIRALHSNAMSPHCHRMGTQEREALEPRAHPQGQHGTACPLRSLCTGTTGTVPLLSVVGTDGGSEGLRDGTETQNLRRLTRGSKWNRKMTCRGSAVNACLP